jgi:diguanylate cyclase (GGDEF)-like protein
MGNTGDRPDDAGSGVTGQARRGQILYRSAHTQVSRMHSADGDTISKHVLGPNAVERAAREADMLRLLDGIRGVPRVLRVPTGSTLVLADVPGTPLAERRPADGSRPSSLPGLVALLDLAIELAELLAGLHRRNVVHGEVHPQVILLDPIEQIPTLIDFEFAATFADQRAGVAHTSSSLETLAYRAPEQTGRTGQGIDHRADLYSLGAVLYELATGQTPFGRGEQDALTLIHDHLARVPTAPAQLNLALPQLLSDVILKLLEKEPARRYQTGDGLAADLRHLRQLMETGSHADAESAAFRIGERDFPLQLRAPSQLVAREAEIGVLAQALTSTTGGGNVVFVTGPPGVGKTALLERLRPIVTAAEGWFIYSRCLRHSLGIHSDAVTQAMRGLGRLLLAEPEAELAVHAEQLRELLGERAPLAATAIPEFGLILDVEPRPFEADLTRTASRGSNGSLGILQIATSPDRPLVLTIDDLHESQTLALELVDSILTGSNLDGLLLVVAYRDDELDADHPLTKMLQRWSDLNVMPPQLRLENLSAPDVAELVAGMLRLRPEQVGELVGALEPRTGGNPRDTIDLLNALRAEGTLVLDDAGWSWDAQLIRHHIGDADRPDLLTVRLDRLPTQTSELLDLLVCLGGQVDLELLQAAAELSAGELLDRIRPALDDGLLELGSANADKVRTVSFRHDRVLQSVDAGLEPQARGQLRLRIARRLIDRPAQSAEVAKLYLTVTALVTDPDERVRVAQLLHRTATSTRATNPVSAERFLAAAESLIGSDDLDEATAKLLVQVQTDRQVMLFSLGKFDEVDSLYRSIESRCPNPLDLADAASLRTAYLNNRGRPQEALDLALDLMQRMGLRVPARRNLAVETEQGIDEIHRWVQDDDLAGDLGRPEIEDRRILAIAKLMKWATGAAFFCDQPMLLWLVTECRRLWEEHGPCPSLAFPLSHAGLDLISTREDFRSGYRLVRRVLSVCEARGYDSEVPMVRYSFMNASVHWFDPLHESLAQAERACDELIRVGDPQMASAGYQSMMPLMLDSAVALQDFTATVNQGLILASDSGNTYASIALNSHRWLAGILQGEFELSSSERDRLAKPDENPVTAPIINLNRALGGLLFGDEPELIRHAAAAVALLPKIPGMYLHSQANLFQALALARGARTMEATARKPLLEQLNRYQSWLEARAADAPGNFSHLVAFVEAERAWTVNDFRAAIGAFDAAMQACGDDRSWQKALITERAAAFHLAHGHEHAARSLMAAARDTYSRWGATGKVEQMHRRYPFLRTIHESSGQPGHNESSLVGVSSDAVDLLAILKASQALSSETEFDRLHARVVEVLTAMSGATAVTVLTWNEDSTEWTLPGAGARQESPTESAGTPSLIDEVPLSAFRYAERTRVPLLVDDATRDHRFATDPYLAGVRCCSLLVVPILSQGVPRVMLVLENRLHPNVFSSDRLDAIMLIAGQLAVSFDHARAQSLREQEAERRLRLLDQLRRRERLLQTLLSIQQDISHRAPLQDILDSVTMGASIMLDGAFVALVLVDPLGDSPPRIPSVCGQRSGRDHDELLLSLARRSIDVDHLVIGGADSGDQEDGLSAAPVHADGRIIGSLVTRSKADDRPASERQGLLTAFAEQVSLALNDANTLEAIREASYDSLTGLASRALFLDRLERALISGTQHGTEVSVLFVDLDRFKAVNDSLGHGAGDDLLAQVAARLNSCIRDTDLAARLGGDEFAVLLENTVGSAAGLSAAERITAALTQPFRLAGKDIFASASVGVAHGAATSFDASELLAQADLAMYRAKSATSRRAVVFEPTMHAEVKERLELEGDLQRAMSSGELHLAYQPLMSLQEGRPIGLEALARWHHPERGMISPAVFIPLAEETGAIVELGRWVLNESCRQVARWRSSGWPELELSINVSGRQLLDANLVHDVTEILAETKLPAKALTLELTETVLMDDPGGTMIQLDDLKRLGVRLSIDDFGTGYSSLSYLRRFPVDKLKIDKSFIDNIATVEEDLAIVRAVIDLTRILKLQTTAEGIETAEQYQLLRELGCMVGQGYFFARPLEVGAVSDYLADQQAATS